MGNFEHHARGRCSEARAWNGREGREGDREPEGLFGVDLKEVDGKACLIEVNECPNIDHGVEDQVLGDDQVITAP